jgi:type I restriction enzyme S subunit
MASDWDTYPISDFVTLSQGLAINAKSKYLLEETGLPLLRITDLINGTQVHFVNEEKAPPKCIATDHELIYTRTGQVGLVYRNKVGVVHNNCFKVIPSPELDKDFLYWFLFQESTKAHVNAVASGSVQKDLNHAAFLTLSIPKPELSEQKAIASILDSLDDKIELNRQMNETLEAMAQALFKSWFVDFDPVIDNALAAGNTIPDEFSERAEQRKGIEKKDDSDIQDLFPDEFEFTEEMGWIPKGWGISEVKDFGQVVCGKTPSKKKAEYYGNDISFIKIPDMHDVAWATTTTDNLSFEGSNSQKNKLIPKGSICVSCIATVGKVLITSREAHTNQQINSVIPAEKNTLYYLYSSFLAMEKNLQDLASGGAVTLNLNTSNFSKIKIILPPSLVLDAYDSAVNSLYVKNLKLLIQNQELAKIRDTLLPKLMSGELRIPDAAALVDEAI